MFIRNALIALAAGLCLIGLICMGMIWEIYRDVREVQDANQQVPTPCGEECPDCHPTSYKPGDLTEDGELVTFVCGGDYLILQSDYALAFRNDGDEQNPKAVFALSSKESGYQEFTSLDALVNRIEQIPEPRIIDYYSTCAGGPNWGIPQPEIDEFFRTMEDLRVELASERDGVMNTICTCPCKNSR